MNLPAPRIPPRSPYRRRRSSYHRGGGIIALAVGVLAGTAVVAGAGILLAALVALGGAWFGWIIMLLVGALWHEFGILKPIAYLPACGIGLLVSLLGAAFRGSSS